MLVAARILVDPNDADDVVTVNGLQDRISLTAGSTRPYESPEYDQKTLHTTRNALLTLGRGVDRFDLDVGEVPVDAFWSVSVYDAAGYFEPNDKRVVSINSVTAARNDDGSVTVHFGDGNAPNTIGIMDGWNYAVRSTDPGRRSSTARGRSRR